MLTDQQALQIAYEEAKAGFDEGGVPVFLPPLPPPLAPWPGRL